MTIEEELKKCEEMMIVSGQAMIASAMGQIAKMDGAKRLKRYNQLVFQVMTAQSNLDMVRKRIKLGEWKGMEPSDIKDSKIPAEWRDPLEKLKDIIEGEQ